VTSLARNQVVLKDCIDCIVGIELTHLPPISMAPRWNSEHVPMIIANPSSQFCRKPAKDESSLILFLEGCMNPV
jgi:hypothetical protein